MSEAGGDLTYKRSLNGLTRTVISLDRHDARTLRVRARKDKLAEKRADPDMLRQMVQFMAQRLMGREFRLGC